MMSLPRKPELATIPVVDIRGGGVARHAIDEAARTLALRHDCTSVLPGPARALLPTMDRITRAWLRRSPSPYVAEVEEIAKMLDISGVWFLNGCYEWGCTALAREEAGAPWLARTLDWPFPGLGRHLEVARMHGPAGHFDNVTWPGFVGCLTASAPGRFAATINQAPMWRRTRHPWLRPYDIALNALRTWSTRFVPPDHLLRQVFETCKTFAEARVRLETTPLARPAIYTLVGCAAGERCVIERTQEGCRTREIETATGNDWLTSVPHWEARIRPDQMFKRTFEQAAENSRLRRTHLAAWPKPFVGTFEWVAPPVLNPFTRIAVEICPAAGVLRVVGYERADGCELAEPATLTCEVAAAA